MSFVEQIEKIDSISLQTLFTNMLSIIQNHEERIKILEDKYQKKSQTSMKKYQKSEKGKAAQKRANAKYYQKKKLQNKF